MVYADKQAMLSKLLNDERYEVISEVYNEHKRLIAALFERKEVQE
ncbi:hypothetical protein [Pontibacillus salipaludis]